MRFPAAITSSPSPLGLRNGHLLAILPNGQGPSPPSTRSTFSAHDAPPGRRCPIFAPGPCQAVFSAPSRATQIPQRLLGQRGGLEALRRCLDAATPNSSVATRAAPKAALRGPTRACAPDQLRRAALLASDLQDGAGGARGPASPHAALSVYRGEIEPRDGGGGTGRKSNGSCRGYFLASLYLV